jgi:hypothetical protein
MFGLRFKFGPGAHSASSQGRKASGVQGADARFASTGSPGWVQVAYAPQLVGMPRSYVRSDARLVRPDVHDLDRDWRDVRAAGVGWVQPRSSKHPRGHKEVEVGIAYAIWSAVGTAVVAVIGIAVLGETTSVLKLAGIVLIMTAVITLNLAGAH